MATAFPKIYYDNRLKDATPAASTTAAGYSVLNIYDWRPYTWWKPTALPATITVNCGSSKAADFFAVYGHTLGTSGCTIECRRSTDNFSANDVLVATKTPTTDDPFVMEFASVSSQYWRLRITGGATMPSLAIGVIGAAFTFPRKLNAGLDPIGRQIVGISNVSEKGRPLGKVIDYEAWTKTLSWSGIDWTWLRSTWLPAWKAHLRANPYIFAWDITDHADEIFLVQSGDAWAAPHVGGQYTDFAFDVSGVV